MKWFLGVHTGCAEAVPGYRLSREGAVRGTRASMAGVTAEESEWDEISRRLKTDAPVITMGAAGAITPLPQNPRVVVKPAETRFVYLLDRDT